jgi:hypothetical protein
MRFAGFAELSTTVPFNGAGQISRTGQQSARHFGAPSI